MHADKKSASKSSNSKPSAMLQRHNETAGTLFQDNRPETIAQRKLQAAKDSMAETMHGLQWQEKANHETAASLSIQRKPLKKGHIGPGVAQLAGHPEDLCILQGGQWVIKRIDKFEMLEYMRLRDIENTGEGMRAEGIVIPHFKGPYFSYQELISKCGFHISGKDEQKMFTKQEGAPGPMLPLPQGKFLVIMENVTGGIPGATAPRDLKIGRHTSDKLDQERHNVEGFSLFTKEKRHDWMDKKSPSRSLGFRDEDQWKKTSKKGLVITSEVECINVNLSKFREEIADASHAPIMVVRDSLLKILDWIKQSDTVYIGASILITFNNNSPGSSAARLIDFEHPVKSTGGSFEHNNFEQYKADMIDGVLNIIKELDNADEWKEMFRPGEMRYGINDTGVGNKFITDNDL